MRWIALLLSFVVGCGFGHAPADAGAVDATADAPAPDAAKAKVVGCAWFSGAWTMVDCTGAAFALEAMTGTDCITHVSAPSAELAGAWGQVKDGAMTLILPALGTQCQGSFDGDTIRGACSLSGGPCAFEASPKP